MPPARYLEKNSKRVPKFDLVFVDEFQDFNKLEVSLINLLGKKNSILIAGDDDQALYFFKERRVQFTFGSVTIRRSMTIHRSLSFIAADVRKS